MEIDGEMIPDDEPPVRHKHQAPGECEVRRRDTVLNEHVDVGICRSRPRCIESMQSNAPVELVRVAVTSDPTPKAPVATKISVPPGRCSVSTHEWTVISSNGFARRYLCKCGIEVREKKDNGFWIAVQYTIGEPRDANHTPPQPRHLHPGPEPDKSPVPKRRAVLVPVQGDYSLDDDSDDSIYMSADERTSQLPIHELSLPSRLRRSSADRTSGGTTVSDAPSSLSGLPLRRLPRRPGSDSLSAVGRSRQVSGSRRTSGSTAEFRTPASPAIELSPSGALSPSVITSQWPLVSANPKPTAPIATHFAPQCSISGAFHRWKVWGNATHRRYTCLGCSTVVKERKFGQPQVWVPAD
ncbi:hypothetical protein BD310DRAFT_515642 [Dichomitus squalens]|uniref:Uncharacterized protein n=1 Tax=Dichomitus squalens TaxID=114155 RepID=A0A4Q9PU12_9APHY|nr:hypothetical protein BD310DRAFT_515642 [Dichomitus squalens]